MIQLRTYQQRAIDKARELVNRGTKRILLVGPTGLGKMVIVAAIIQLARSLGQRCLFVAHRLELLDQAVDQLRRFGVEDIGVMRAFDQRTNPNAPTQVASWQTLSRRKLPPADIIFSDEAHHDCSDSRREILAKYPEAIVLGWTATPVRLDNKPLKDVYQALIEIASYSELIAGGFIVSPTCYSTPAIVDLSQVKMSAGDYAIDGLEYVMNQPQVNGDIVKEWTEKAGGRPTVLFACTVKHSQALVQRFVEAGVRAEHLDGTTDEGARRACLRRLKDGMTQLVSNVGILTEGWDEPAAKAIVMARPTQSLGLFLQIAGRGLRPWYDVKPVLIDHAGNIDRFGLPHEDRVWGLYDTPRLKKASPYRTCPRCFAYVLKNPCELCGYAPTPQEMKIREDRAGALVERTEADVRRVFFIAKLVEARNKGFRPGYVAVKFREKFSEPMPWSWGQEVKQAMTSEWEKRIERRTEERAYWNRQNEGSVFIDVPDAQEEEQEEYPTIDQEEIPF